MIPMAEPALLFWCPAAVSAYRPSGSAVRPVAMLNAFRELGVEVVLVDGPSRERAAKWNEALQPGARFLGVYCELSTMPMALADPDHLPRAPFFDFRQFANLGRRGVPVTAFYRDVYWRFPHYAKSVPFLKRMPAQIFYRLEAWQLSRYVDHIFLPSMRMQAQIPFIRDKAAVSALPPGGVTRQRPVARSEAPLKLFYVGGVGGEQYDIGPMLRAVEAVDGVRLTLCCRETEWQTVRNSYGKLCNVDVVHHSGAELDRHYQEADIFLMWWKMGEYLRFAMPVKLGEAVGWGVPVITNSDCEMGDVVEREGLGWAVETEGEVVALLKRLRDRRGELSVKQAQVVNARDRHSWRARAETVLATLKACREQQK